MAQKNLSELTDQELLAKAKKIKSNNQINAFLIGLCIGIIIYAVAKNNFGFFGLIPVLIAFKVFNKPNNNVELIKLLNERNLN